MRSYHIIRTAGPSSDYRIRQSRACIICAAVNAARVRDIIKRFKSNPSESQYEYIIIFFK